MRKTILWLAIITIFTPVLLYGQRKTDSIPSLPMKDGVPATKTPKKTTVNKNAPVPSLTMGAKSAAAASEDSDPEGDMEFKVDGKPKKSLFKSSDNIDYKVSLKSTYDKKQDGQLTVLITTDMGEKVTQKSYPVNIGKKGSKDINISMPKQKPGFYQVKFMLNLSFYDDTVKRIFGVDPEKITAPVHKPDDFNVFWDKSKDALKKIQPQFKVTRDEEQSTKEKDVYLVEMHSWGNAVIRGWLTMPVKRLKKIAVKYRLPGYVVTMLPTMDDDEFAVFNLNVRGNGNSKDALKYNGQYNLYHINSRDEYIYRAVYMDCVRGMDFISTYADYFGFDMDHVAAVGGSQGGALAIALAGMDTRVKAVTAELALYADLREAIKIAPVLYPEKQSPVWMLDDYVKKNKTFTEQRLFALWDYYDPINFAPQVKCPVLLAVSLLDELAVPRGSFAMFNQLGSKVKETWVSPNLTHEVDESYYQYQYFWTKEVFVLP